MNSDSANATSAFRLKGEAWDSSTYLNALGHAVKNAAACDRLVEEQWGVPSFQALLWHEICSEYDARRFAEHIHQLGPSLTTEFQCFEKAWLADENNHYSGFRQLYVTAFGGSVIELDAEIADRRASLDSLMFLQDEFSACVVLAYDEAVTAKAYPMDYKIYDRLGDSALSRWIRRVCRDELYHCRNVTEVLKHRHADRLAEIPGLLATVMEWDQHSAEYSATFVLDHQRFPAPLLNESRGMVLKLCDGIKLSSEPRR